MSRKSNRLKRRVAILKQEKARAFDIASAYERHNKDLHDKLKHEAALTIKIADLPAGLMQRGKRFRLDFVADAFEWDYLRRGDSQFGYSVTDYARRIGRDLADKVARAIEDHISGRTVKT